MAEITLPPEHVRRERKCLRCGHAKLWHGTRCDSVMLVRGKISLCTCQLFVYEAVS